VVEQPLADTVQFEPVPPASDPQKAMEALRQKLKEPQVTIVMPEREQPVAADEQPTVRVEVPTRPERAERAERTETARRPEPRPRRDDRAMQFEPIKGPPTGLSPEKEKRLHELTQRYFADEITPQEYHAERAKIMSGP
jgi:hypothetical protein